VEEGDFWVLYGSYLNHFSQPDTIIPDASNPQSFNRYSYVLNNPIRYNDPTGHKCVGNGEECLDNDGKPINGGGDDVNSGNLELDDNENGGNEDNGGNNHSNSGDGQDDCQSVVCKDPSLVSTGQVQTNVGYPTYQTPNTYDGPYAEKTGTWLDIILLIMDGLIGFNYHTNLPSRMGNNYVYAKVNYEVHTGEYGYYTVATSLKILSLQKVDINNPLISGSPNILIKPDQLLVIDIQPVAIPGKSATIDLTFSSQFSYSNIIISATYP
jgi:hypothetical protein